MSNIEKEMILELARLLISQTEIIRDMIESSSASEVFWSNRNRNSGSLILEGHLNKLMNLSSNWEEEKNK